MRNRFCRARCVIGFVVRAHKVLSCDVLVSSCGHKGLLWGHYGALALIKGGTYGGTRLKLPLSIRSMWGILLVAEIFIKIIVFSIGERLLKGG